ncbi:MAG: hypothetical protein ACI8W8_002766, partial [Rhodothermales bacterium]
ANAALLLGNTAMGDTAANNLPFTTGAALLAHLLITRLNRNKN